MLGRERRVVDIPLDHPSCSGQHAVVQFRLGTAKNEQGDTVKMARYVTYPPFDTSKMTFLSTPRPYLIDLESTNGTFLNGDKISASRYYELRVGDVVKFGASTREFVVMHEDLDV
jgi:smad nuclear-interacting protein 1